MEATYKEIPVGLKGRYLVERTQNGLKEYLGDASVPEHIAKLPFGTAVAAVKILEHQHEVHLCTFRPWPADGLTMKPVPRFCMSADDAVNYAVAFCLSGMGALVWVVVLSVFFDKP